MLVTGIHSACGNGEYIAAGETKEVDDSFGEDLCRAGYARPAGQPNIETMQLTQAAPFQKMQRGQKPKGTK